MAGTAAGSSGACASEATGPSSTAVTGSVRGSVDGVLLEGGVTTRFLGPGSSAFSDYAQSFEAGVDAGGKLVNAFELRIPSDRVTASFTGLAGAAASELGVYSELDCGWFRFEMTFPVPDGIVCPSFIGNCRPDCEPSGEAGVCMPAAPKVRYAAESACSDGAASARGSWQLELTSICPLPASGTLLNFQTHGRLTATLVNELDAADTIELELEF